MQLDFAYNHIDECIIYYTMNIQISERWFGGYVVNCEC